MDDILKILATHPAPSPAARIRPCLLGPTGSGKTTRAVALGEALGLPVFRLLLSTAQPEDILGLPVVEGRTTAWTLPQWAARAEEEPCLLLLDEMDKATGEQLAVALTLLAEGRVRDVTLHDRTVIVAAMQPVDPAVWLSDETGRAISARLCYVPTGYDWRWLGSRWGVDLTGLPQPEEHGLPILPSPCARHVEYALSILAADYPDVVTTSILAGMFAAPVCEALRTAWQSRAEAAPPTTEEVIKLARDDISVLDKLTVHELTAGAADVWLHGTPKILEEVLVKVWTEGGEDDAKNFLEVCYEELKAKCENSPDGTVDVLGDADEPEVGVAIERAAARIAKAWKARAGTTREDEEK